MLIFQERKRLLSSFSAVSHDDLEDCRRLIELHYQWVTKGDNAESDGMLPTPYKAFGERTSGAAADSKREVDEKRPKKAPLTPKHCQSSKESLDQFFQINDRFKKACLTDDDVKPRVSSPQKKADCDSTACKHVDTSESNNSTHYRDPEEDGAKGCDEVKLTNG